MPSAKLTAKEGAKNVPKIPFVRAAHKLRQPAFQYNTAVLGTAIQNFGPNDIPSGGFLRSIILAIQGFGGIAGGGVLAADAPWNILNSVELSDVSGQALVYGNLNGYDLYLANRYGGYLHGGIPDYVPAANLVAVDNPAIFLRIPVEIDHTDGYGSLPNLNAAEPYRVRLGFNTAANVWAVAPDVAPAFAVRAFSEDWSLPSEVDGNGNPQSTTPPNMNTTQYWSKTILPLVAGANDLRLTRMGNLLRNIILIFRTAAGARFAAPLPVDMRMTWDRYQLFNEDAIIRQMIMAENCGHYGFANPDGVLAYQFTEDGGAPANEKRNLWVPTMQPTEIRISFTAAAGLAGGTLEVLTNDVAAAG